MTSPDAAIAARPAECSACGAALDSLGRCTKCGATFGEAYRCPLCQAVSDVESSTILYQCCRTCGGPRIPPTESPVSEAEVTLLRSARSEQLRAGAFRAGSGFALASGVLSLLVTAVVLLATSPGEIAKVAAFLATLVPFALAFFAMRQARSHAGKLNAALQQAWLLAATRVVGEHQGSIAAQELAKALRVDEPRAELLLAEVSVQQFVHDPAEAPARLRVTELADPSELGEAADEAHTVTTASKP